MSILNMYISMCWKLESSYASEFTEYALSLFWFPLAMYDFSYYCQILIQIQCSLSKLLQKYNQVPCKHSKKKSTSSKVLIGEVGQLQIYLLYISNFLISKNEILFIKSPILNNILSYLFPGFFDLKDFYSYNPKFCSTQER